MGLLDQLALHAAGAMGSFQQGQLKGEATKYARDEAEKQAQEELQRQALERSIMQAQNDRNEQFRRDQLGQNERYRRDALDIATADRESKLGQQAALAREAMVQRQAEAEANRQNRLDYAKLVAGLKPQPAAKPYKPDQDALRANDVLPSAEQAYATIKGLLAKGFKPTSANIGAGVTTISQPHGLIEGIKKIAVGTFTPQDAIDYATAVRSFAEAEQKAIPGARGMGINEQRHEVLARDPKALDAAMGAIRSAAKRAKDPNEEPDTPDTDLPDLGAIRARNAARKAPTP